MERIMQDIVGISTTAESIFRLEQTSGLGKAAVQSTATLVSI